MFNIGDPVRDLKVAWLESAVLASVECWDITAFSTGGGGGKEVGQVMRGSPWQWLFAIFWGWQMWTGAPLVN